MKIDVSQQTFERLQSLADPLVDTADDVISRLLDQAEQKGGSTMSSPSRPSHKSLTPGSPAGLRGFLHELWDLVIEPMPTTRFTLQDVYARKQPLVDRRPHVKEIEASIRAGLEKLRDKGLIEFVDYRGTYRRIV